MSSLHLDYLFGVVGLACNCVLLFVVVNKSRWRAFPIFALLSVYTPVQDLVLDCASRLASQQGYRLFYWTFAIGDYALQLALMFEIARTVLRPNREWVRNSRLMLVCLCLGGSVFVALLVAIGVSSVNDAHELIYRRESLFTSLLTCVCLLALSVVANQFGLPRKDHVRAIAQGLAVWNITSIIGDVLLAGGSGGGALTLDHIRMAVWDVTLIYWARSLWRPELVRGNRVPLISLGRVTLANEPPPDVREI